LCLAQRGEKQAQAVDHRGGGADALLHKLTTFKSTPLGYPIGPAAETPPPKRAPSAAAADERAQMLEKPGVL
jgi:hypothetical protein